MEILVPGVCLLVVGGRGNWEGRVLSDDNKCMKLLQAVSVQWTVAKLGSENSGDQKTPGPDSGLT